MTMKEPKTSFSFRENKSLKQQAREEFRKLIHSNSWKDTDRRIDAMVDKILAACIAKVPEDDDTVPYCCTHHQKEKNWRTCRSRMLEGLKELQSDALIPNVEKEV